MTEPQSPCRNECTLDAGGGLCTGCFRTIAEITSWAMMSDAEKKAVVQKLPAREAQWRERHHRGGGTE